MDHKMVQEGPVEQMNNVPQRIRKEACLKEGNINKHIRPFG